jgi:hypothetical protein
MKNVKSEILTAGLKKQEAIIADFRKRISEVMQNEGSAKGEFDNFYQTFPPETLAEVNILNNEVEFANQELEEMRRIDCELQHKQAEFGAVVKTDRKTFFVSASLEDFDVADSHFFGVSVHSPLYFAMKGKKPGECFRTRNIEYLIEDIY